MKQGQAKHKICRRIGYCIWNMPNCPTVKGRARTYAAGLQGKNAHRKKLTAYGEMLLEKQKLRAHYALTESQLRAIYLYAKRIETRLDSIVYHAGFAPTIFAAKQFVSHRHILVDGKIVDRASYIVKPGQVISINAEKSPKIAEVAKAVTTEAPAYFEVDKEQLKIKLVTLPTIDAIPFSVESMRVVEYYAR